MGVSKGNVIVKAEKATRGCQICREFENWRGRNLDSAISEGGTEVLTGIGTEADVGSVASR